MAWTFQGVPVVSYMFAHQAFFVSGWSGSCGTLTVFLQVQRPEAFVFSTDVTVTDSWQVSLPETL